MPRTAFAARFATMLLAVWFAVVTAEPASLHSCPVHGGLSGHAHGAIATARHHRAPVREPHHSAPHQCTCPGACCTVTPARLDAPVVVTVVETAAAPAALFDDANDSYRPATRDFARPPSIGPPTVHSH